MRSHWIFHICFLDMFHVQGGIFRCVFLNFWSQQYPVASHPRHRALFELKSVLSFYVQFWHSEANLNIPKISWYSQSPNILHKIGTFQNTVNFLGKILILLGFEFALCFFGFEMVAHGRFLQGIDVLHTVIESLRIIAGAGADKTETSR